MADIPPINQALLTVLENQITRTHAAFDGMSDDLFRATPGGDCNSIQAITQHMIALRRFQLKLLGSPLAEQAPSPKDVASVADALARLEAGEALVRQALMEHDPADWYATPATPREGAWGEEATLLRFVRPFNDFTNHLGGIRAIRRILGSPAQATQ